MDKKVKAEAIVIKPGAVCPQAVFTPKKVVDNISRVKPTEAWRKGKMGHYSLGAYFDDGVTGPSRSLLVQLTGYSRFGLGFFNEETAKKLGRPTKEEEDEKRQKPASIAFDLDKSPDFVLFASAVNAVSKEMAKTMIPHLKSQVAPGRTDITVVYRGAARAPTGFTQKQTRVTCYPGRTELNTKDSNESVSMNEYKLGVEGDYKVLLEWAGWDASFSKDVLSWGPVFYGKKLKEAEPVIREALEWIEDEPTTALLSEDEVGAQLRAKKKAEKAEKQAANKKRKHNDEEPPELSE